MASMRCPIFWMFLLLPVLSGQEAKRPSPPPGATTKPLPPVQEPERTPVERKDLLQKFKPASPLEGTYRLQAVGVPGGKVVKGYQGYLVVGKDYLSIHLQGPGVAKDLPSLQAGFRKYRIEGSELVMHSLLGHRNLPDGKVVVEGKGVVERRGFLKAGNVLRISKSAEDYLEFVRIE